MGGYAGLGYHGLGYAGLGAAAPAVVAAAPAAVVHNAVLGTADPPNPVHAVAHTYLGTVHSSHVGVCTNFLGEQVSSRQNTGLHCVCEGETILEILWKCVI